MKKRSGLVKSIIITAIVFVVAFVSTLCFVASLGTDAIKHIADGYTPEQYIEERFPGIKNAEGWNNRETCANDDKCKTTIAVDWDTAITDVRM